MDYRTSIIVYSICLIILLGLSFFFSSSDMAYGSVDLLHYEKEINNKKTNNKKIKKLKTGYRLAKNYDKTISTILLLNDTVNAGLDTLSTLLGVNLAFLILGGNTTQSENWGFICSIICLIIKILFGEIIAKSLGKIYNFKFSVLYSPIINTCSYIFLPVTFLVSNFGKLVTKPLVSNITDIIINEDDLHEMVDEIEEQGSLDNNQVSYLHEIVRYTHTEAYEVMTPRVDLVAIDIDDDIDEILNNSEIYKYTRVPVYKDTIDNIIGYVKTRKLFIDKINNVKIDLNNYLITPMRFTRSTEINDILKNFKKNKTHFALIMDEYGGVEGAITMEDILEEIVGEIWDEKDDPDIPYLKRRDGTYIVDGSYNLEDFCSLFDIDYERIDTEYVTIGGFCIELLDDQFPKLNDTIDFENLSLKVIALNDNNTIKKLLVTIKNKED